MPPTILLLTVDALRADRVGATTPDHRPQRNLTPNIDTIAASGTAYTSCYSTGPGTRQGFPGILGSSPALAHGGYARFGGNRPALAEQLHNAGYHTYAVHSNAQLTDEFGYNRGFDEFDDLGAGRNDDNKNDEATESSGSFADHFRDVVGRHVYNYPTGYRLLKQLESRVSGINRPYANATSTRKRAATYLRSAPKPLFLWTHFMDVHVPYYPPKHFREEGGLDASDAELVKQWLNLNTRPEQLNQADVERLEQFYDATVRYVDYEIGKLIEVAEATLDKPVIVVTADHGEEFREHGGLTHSPKMYDELVRVPLVVKGRNVNQTAPVSVLDIAPTLLAPIGVSTEDFWGNDLTTSDTKQNNEFGRAVFSEASHPLNGAREEIDLNHRVTACRTNRWTYIRDDGQNREELFDRTVDPGEQTPCGTDYPSVRDTLAERTITYREKVLETSPMLHEREMNAGIEQRLKSLGYLNE